MFVGAEYSTAKLKTLDLTYNLFSDFSQLKGRARECHEFTNYVDDFDPFMSTD